MRWHCRDHARRKDRGRNILALTHCSGHSLTGYLEVRYDETRQQVIYEPVKLVQDFRNFDFLSPWEAMTSLPGDEKAHKGSAT